MTHFTTVSADQVILAILATIALRELLVMLLPERVAGPEGWLIRTHDEP